MGRSPGELCCIIFIFFTETLKYKMKSVILTLSCLCLILLIFQSQAQILDVSLACGIAVERCCRTRNVRVLASGCFIRHNCPEIQWMGENACIYLDPTY